MFSRLSFQDFCDAFQARPDDFSYDGKEALFDYLIDLENMEGEERELDVIEICGSFAEYENLEEFNIDYKENCEDMSSLESRFEVIRVGVEGFIIRTW